MTDPTTDPRRDLETARAAARLLEASTHKASEQAFPPDVQEHIRLVDTAAYMAAEEATQALRAYDQAVQP